MPDQNQFKGVVDSLFQGMSSVISSKTVVGEPTQIGDTIILPLVDVSFGIGAGSSKTGENKKDSGIGGLTGKMSPSAVLIIKNGQTKLVNVKNQDVMTKVLDMIPDVIDRFTTNKEDMPGDDEAINIAFPEEGM